MRKPKSPQMGVVARAGLVVLTLVAAMFIGIGPASAHDSHLCSSTSTGAVNEVSYGTTRQLDDASHYHDIGWTYAAYGSCSHSFPSGGRIEVAVQFLVKGDNGCTTTSAGSGSWFLYDAAERHTLATDVRPTTCYRLKWRAKNTSSDHITARGALFALIS
jgi:hypothetical protein